MANKKTHPTAAARSTAVATLKPQALTPEGETVLAAVIGSGDALARMPGAGGEIVRQEGVLRVSGRDYATREGTVPAAEIYFIAGAKSAGDGVWLGERTRSPGSIPRRITSAS